MQSMDGIHKRIKTGGKMNKSVQVDEIVGPLNRASSDTIV